MLFVYSYLYAPTKSNKSHIIKLLLYSLQDHIINIITSCIGSTTSGLLQRPINQIMRISIFLFVVKIDKCI